MPTSLSILTSNFKSSGKSQSKLKNSLRNNSRVHCRLFGLLSTLPLTVRSIQIRKNVWETFWVDQGTLQRGTWGKCAAHHGYSDPSHCIEPGCKEKKKGNTIIGTCDLFHPGQKYEPIEEKYLADTEPTFNHIICYLHPMLILKWKTRVVCSSSLLLVNGIFVYLGQTGSPKETSSACTAVLT